MRATSWLGSVTSGPVATGRPVGRRLRCARGGVLGLTALLLAYAGHVAAGGSTVPLPDLAVPGAVATGVCLVLGRRRLSFPTLLGALLGTQLLLHVWFEHPLTGSMSGSMTGSMGGMSGDPRLMVAAHVGAAAVTALVLLAAENGLWDLLALLAARLRTATTPLQVPPVGARPSLVPAVGEPSSTSRVLVRSRPRRGPPVTMPA